MSTGPIPNLDTLRTIHVEYEIDDSSVREHLVIELTPATNDRGVTARSINADFHASLVWELIGFLVSRRRGAAGRTVIHNEIEPIRSVAATLPCLS